MSCSYRAPIEEVKWRRWQRPGLSTACLATVCFSPPGQRWAPAALWTLQFSLLSRWASRFCYTHSASRRLSRASGTVRSCLLNRTCLKLTKQVNECQHAQVGAIFFNLHWIAFFFRCLFHYLLLAMIVTQSDHCYTQQLSSTWHTPKSEYFRTALVSMVTYR